jgi:hypothetical protein
MMQKCFDHLQGQPQDTVLKYALLESFLMHIRVICAFLFAKVEKRNNRKYPVYKGDIRAEDFFDHPVRWQPQPNQFLDDTCARINKALAHLTEDRLNKQEQWDILRIYNTVIQYLEEFQRLATNTNLDPILRELNLEMLDTVSVSKVTTSVQIVSIYTPSRPSNEHGSL